MKNIFLVILQNLAKTFKGETYSVSPDYPMTALLEYSCERFFSLVRCLLKGIVFSLDPRKLIFVGAGVELKNKKMIRFGRGVTLGRGVIIDGLSKDGVRIADGASIGAYGIIRATSGLGKLGKGFCLGRRSSFDAFAFVGASGGVVIGDNVIMGQKVSFHSENHLHDRIDVLIRSQGTTCQGIVVEDDCWIGSNVIFLDGAHVSHGCVIGAGAVVRGYIPPNSIAVGMPARVIKTRGVIKSE